MIILYSNTCFRWAGSFYLTRFLNTGIEIWKTIQVTWKNKTETVRLAEMLLSSDFMFVFDMTIIPHLKIACDNFSWDHKTYGSLELEDFKRNQILVKNIL